MKRGARLGPNEKYDGKVYRSELLLWTARLASLARGAQRGGTERV